MAIGSEDSDLSGDETFDEWGKFELWSILGQWVTHVYKQIWLPLWKITKEIRKFLTMPNGDQNGGRKEESDNSGHEEFIDWRKSFNNLYTKRTAGCFWRQVSFWYRRKWQWIRFIRLPIRRCNRCPPIWQVGKGKTIIKICNIFMFILAINIDCYIWMCSGNIPLSTKW